MPGTEIGTAYVQIVPSAQGIAGSLKKVMGGEADEAGQAAGSKISGKIKAAIGAAAIGTAITAGIKKSIDEGAKLEQSIGGIETLFKSSANEMIKNADNAYKTAGISANTYMEQATSFSASLLQATGKDTKKAASAANQAIIDMSDNANKMGSNIEDIQNAYQGFAKQNYTMLDNLKLGYGGTKTEMERLLSDAQKITGQKYDISNLADVYDAIHVIQTDLDITGTSAKEAATTLSGSMASMKAAANNFLGDLALGRNIGPAMAGLAESAGTFLFGNLVPAIGNILKSLPAAVSTLIKSGLPKFSKAGKDITNSIAKGIKKEIPKAIKTLPKNFGKALDGISQRLPEALKQGGKIVEKIAMGIVTNIPALANAAGKMISKIAEFIKQNFPTIVTKGGELVGKITVGIIKNLPKIVVAAAKLTASLISSLLKAVPTLMSTGAKFIAGLVKGLGGSALSAIKTAAGKVVSALTTPMRRSINTVRSIAKTIKSYLSFSGLAAKVSGVFNSIKSKITAPINKAKDLVKSAIGKIKGIFPLRLGKIFSGIQLPHFHISGGKIPWGIGGKGKKPSVSIDWYKKGGVFDSPSVIGVGEAGREAVVPLSGKYMRPFAKTIAKEMPEGSGTVYNIGDVTLDVRQLKDVLTLEQLVSVLKRAKEFS